MMINFMVNPQSRPINRIVVAKGTVQNYVLYTDISSQLDDAIPSDIIVETTAADNYRGSNISNYGFAIGSFPLHHSVTILNKGDIRGYGGAANGGTGGKAMLATVPAVFINNGNIQAGGGGGGVGKAADVYSPPTDGGDGSDKSPQTPVTPGFCTAYSAGAGGRGQGWNQSALSGSAGPGPGGPGGPGAAYGASGTAGSSATVSPQCAPGPAPTSPGSGGPSGKSITSYSKLTYSGTAAVGPTA